MGNLSREALAHYLDYSFKQTVASATWEILGDDIDDMSVDLNPDTETKKNILGQTKTTDNGCRYILCKPGQKAVSEV